MLTVATLLKRLEVLERGREGAPEIKVFIHYPERDPSFWKPENPEFWQQSHPKGRAILLSMRDCGCRRLEGSSCNSLKKA
ncbi:MAG: hypothetical protein NHB15_08655 [Methanosarcina barkeri]|nr:hypothetical protein [Methanosarcina sp. ERenArc_MAG2]